MNHGALAATPNCDVANDYRKWFTNSGLSKATFAGHPAHGTTGAFITDTHPSTACSEDPKGSCGSIWMHTKRVSASCCFNMFTNACSCSSTSLLLPNCSFHTSHTARPACAVTCALLQRLPCLPCMSACMQLDFVFLRAAQAALHVHRSSAHILRLLLLCSCPGWHPALLHTCQLLTLPTIPQD